MKNLTTILILFIALSAFSQNRNKTEAVAYESPYLDEIDESFISNIYSPIQSKAKSSVKSASNISITESPATQNSKLMHHYKNTNNPKFDFLVDYYNQLATSSNSIMDEKFLKKPSLDNLLSIYLNNELKSNTNTGKNKASKSEIIEWELAHFPTMESLVVEYYAILFSHAIDNNLISNSLNLDFGTLGLSEKEGSLLYHTILMRLRQARSLKTKDCDDFLKDAHKLPTFNGQKFNEFEPIKIKEIIVNIRHQNKYWDTISNHKEATKEIIDQYERCTK